jgi:hypothetical protein
MSPRLHFDSPLGPDRFLHTFDEPKSLGDVKVSKVLISALLNAVVNSPNSSPAKTITGRPVEKALT